MVLNATSVASRYGTTGLPLTHLVLPVANRPTRLLTRGSHTWVVDAGGRGGQWVSPSCVYVATMGAPVPIQMCAVWGRGSVTGTAMLGVVLGDTNPSTEVVCFHNRESLCLSAIADGVA